MTTAVNVYIDMAMAQREAPKANQQELEKILATTDLPEQQKHEIRMLNPSKLNIIHKLYF